MAEKQADPLLGKRIDDFRVDAKLGEGAMGAVYKATQVSLERHVALKVLPPKLVRQHPDFVKRFVREAKVAAQINHPNIVQVHAVGNFRGIQFIAMEFIKGSSVADIIIKHGPLPERKALTIVAQAANGLAAGEVRNMIHRDVKPENLLVTVNGLVKVADFGLAKNTQTESMVTKAGTIMGTPSFMSPEQARSGDLDSRSDIYSLGASLFQMVTGTVPFRGDTPLSTLFMHIEERLPDPKSFREDLSDFTAELIKKMMAKDPKDRYQSFIELGELLLEIPKEVKDDGGKDISELAGLVGPASGLTQLSPTQISMGAPARKGTGKWILAGIGLTVAVVAAALGLWLGGVLDPLLSKETTPEEGGGGTPAALKWSLLEPMDGAFISAMQVAVAVRIDTGKVDSVRVNDQPAKLKEDRFVATIGLPDEGPVSLVVTAEGKAGKAEKRIGIVVDRTPPVVDLGPIAKGASIHTKQERFLLEGSVADANPATVTVNGAPRPIDEIGGKFSAELPLEDRRSLEVKIEAMDRAGNRGTFTFTLTLDRAPPELIWVSPPDRRAWGDPVQEIRVRFSEPVRDVKIDGRPAEVLAEGLYATSFALKLGENEVFVEAVDRAGNVLKQTDKVHYQKHDPAVLEAEAGAWKELQALLEGELNAREKRDAVRAFLESHPEGKHTEAAGVLLTKFVSELEPEETAFREACTASDAAPDPWKRIAIWVDFLAERPDSPFAREAEAKLASARVTDLPLQRDGVERSDREGYYRNRKDGAVMVLAPTGDFSMGADDGDPEDGPQVTCRLTGYYVAVHEVTNERFAAFLEAVGRDADEEGNPYLYDCLRKRGGKFPWGLTRADGKWKPADGRGSHPAIFVTWYGARAYAEWAGCALPTEAQWERAARGETVGPFPWGAEPSGDERANVANRQGGTRPVGSFPQGQSSGGCLDMAGNVAEWCRDTFSGKFLTDMTDGALNPLIRGEGEKSLRGGSWFHPEKFARTTSRGLRLDPAGGFPTVGFRCVKR
ncbi:MAG: protein kinase domain-containing protein [Planctomycetota bacterium]|jgi:formylglycine-generating enzyme required for sulfatase activity/tRNA A-37 threonylcarbamoyl transferase component Bud32